jgi:dipeptidyl aminopeptidase/acylaminoacyl peptidase
MYRLALAAVLCLACGLTCNLASDPVWAEEADTASSGLEIPTLDDFLSDPDYWSPEMSPSGRFLAGVRRIEGQDFILTVDLNSENFDRIYKSVGDVYVNWIDWVTEDRMLISLTGYVDIRTGKQMTRQQLKDWTDKSRQIPRKYTRLVSMDRQSGETVAMFGDNKALNRNFSLGRVTDFLPGDPDHILMPARMSGDLDLFRVDVRDGSYERIAIGTDFTTAWFTDRSGEPAFRLNVNPRGTVLTVYAREDRENGKIKWRKVRKIRLDDNETSDAAAEFSILFPGPTTETYYVSARREGRDFAGIYLYDFETDEFRETIRESDRVDIENAFFNRDTRELLGVYYYDDRLTIEMDDSGIQAHLDGLNTYFDDRANVVPIDSSEDGKRWLLKVSGPDIPPSYHYYDLDIAFEVLVGENQLSMRGKSLGAMQVIEYTARDGLKLYGYLTRPATAKEGDNPPLIIMPHGGPEMRDYFDYDMDVQILAAQGYQVFQPNFRGSSGYGLTFADLGRRQWGRGMQTDIEDGYTHLIEAGLADAGEACILGYSYGGYAALAAATQTPDLYRCIIDGAGISDLEAFVKWQRKERGSDSEVYDYWLEHIGDPQSEKETLRSYSPVNNADRIMRPVLLLHGKDDGIVPFDQSRRMQKAMEKAGKSVKLVELEESGHTYMSDKDERLYYTEILTFLNEHLPVN